MTFLKKSFGKKQPEMNEGLFWRIIGKLDWNKSGDDNAVVAPAVAVLTQMSVKDILQFQDILAEKLHALDGEQYARQIGVYAYKDAGKPFSTDLFLYARCCVVANGREFFEQVLTDPRKMPKDIEFEALLYVARLAYERKTGEEYDYLTQIDFETFSNKAGWP